MFDLGGLWLVFAGCLVSTSSGQEGPLEPQPIGGDPTEVTGNEPRVADAELDQSEFFCPLAVADLIEAINSKRQLHGADDLSQSEELNEKANSRLKEVQAELAEFRAENDVSPESPILDDPTSEWSVQEAYFKAREQLLRQVDHSRITSCTYTGWTKSSDTITASFRYTGQTMTEAEMVARLYMAIRPGKPVTRGWQFDSLFRGELQRIVAVPILSRAVTSIGCATLCCGETDRLLSCVVDPTPNLLDAIVRPAIPPAFDMENTTMAGGLGGALGGISGAGAAGGVVPPAGGVSI